MQHDHKTLTLKQHNRFGDNIVYSKCSKCLPLTDKHKWSLRLKLASAARRTSAPTSRIWETIACLRLVTVVGGLAYTFAFRSPQSHKSKEASQANEQANWFEPPHPDRSTDCRSVRSATDMRARRNEESIEKNKNKKKLLGVFLFQLFDRHGLLFSKRSTNKRTKLS